MRFRNDFPLKSEAFSEHPDIDVGHGGSYFYGGKIDMVTKFRPSFVSDVERDLPNQNLASKVVNSYMRAAPLNQ